MLIAPCYREYDYYTTLSTIDGGYSSTVLFQGCTSMFPSLSTTAVPARTKQTNLSPATITGPVTMWAQPITVAYQSSDVSMYTTSTASSTGTSPTAEPNARVTTDHAAATSTSDTGSLQQPSSGLSTGAKAGIGVGAAVGAVLVIAIITSLLFWRFRKNAQQKAMRENQVNPTPFVYEVQSYPKAQIGPPQELATSYHNNPVGNGPRFELEA